jgi:serine/threonine-protein kinase
MSSPPPDHGYPPDQAYFEGDPDADTGPVQIAAATAQAPIPTPTVDSQETQVYRLPPGAGPPSFDAIPAEESFASRFTAPLTVDPRAPKVRGMGVQPATVLAIVGVVVLIAALVFVLLRLFDKPDSSDAQAASSAGPTTSATAQSADQEKLLHVLPPGYAASACAPLAPPPGTLAKVSCRANSDAGGPPAASYTLVADTSALRATFDDIVAAARVVNCPGNIQSPGPWRRNATPQQISGTLFCGFRQDTPTVAWTDDADLMVGSVDGAASGPNLDQLYVWWSSHS